MAIEATYASIFQADEFATDNGHPDWVAVSDLTLEIEIEGAFALGTETTLNLKNLPNGGLSGTGLAKGQVFKFDTEYLRVTDVLNYTENNPTLATADIVVERGQYGSAVGGVAGQGLALADGDKLLEQDVNLKLRVLRKATHLIQNYIFTPIFEAGFQLVDPDDGSLFQADQLLSAALLQSIHVFDLYDEYVQAQKIGTISAGEYSDAVFRMVERAGTLGLDPRAESMIKETLFDLGVAVGQYVRS